MTFRPLIQHVIEFCRSNRDTSPRKDRGVHIESLEDRQLLAADFRTVDGTGNNLTHTDWGSTGEDLLRTVPAEYADGISTPAGSDRPSARLISNLIAAQTVDSTNNRDMSAFVYAWGQFLDHDIDLTPNGTTVENFSVPVPMLDPAFDPKGTGSQSIYLARSIYDPATGTSASTPRQQLNVVTAYIDGSQIYGSDPARAAALRTFVGGRLQTSAGDLLPLNSLGLANDNPLGAPTTSLFVAGDVRANENIELTAMHTLFLREHNYWADKFAAQHPDWSDEQVFQQARRIVVSELQSITYNEFLPALLGHALPAYRGYNPQVNPGIANEFSTAAFRLGHSMLGDDVEFLDNQGNEVHDAVELRDAFFNPQLIQETGIDSILKYLASDQAQELDSQVVDDVRNFLFGEPGQGGLDLASLNIQRGRDHGLADYNATRVAYGLNPVKTFADITSDPQLQAELKQAYGDVSNIDLWVGALSENHIRGGSTGPLLDRILSDQFQRLRDGDRFWYQRDLNASQRALVQATSLADIIARNTTTTNLQENVFFFRTSVSGRVFADANANGRIDRGEPGIAGIAVRLLDADGNTVATTVTDRNGQYSFNDLDLGDYQVRIAVLPKDLTTGALRDAQITRGDEANPINFGVRVKSTPRTPNHRPGALAEWPNTFGSGPSPHSSGQNIQTA